MVLGIFQNVDFSVFSIFTFILVLAFLEFCVFCYFTPDLFALFKKKKNNDKQDLNNTVDDLSSLVMSLPKDEWKKDELNEEDIKPLVFPEEKWKSDELSDEEINSLIFPEEEWKEDPNNNPEVKPYSILLDIDPDFKLDEFYETVYDIYSKVVDYYSEDEIKGVSSLMTKELYKENVRQLDYFRRNNLQHVVKIVDYLNCKILKCQIIDREVYVRVELKLDCYDYIMNRTSLKVEQGTNKKVLSCKYHLVFKRKVKPVRTVHNNLNDSNMMFDDENWILSSNKIVRRRVK